MAWVAMPQKVGKCQGILHCVESGHPVYSDSDAQIDSDAHVKRQF